MRRRQLMTVLLVFSVALALTGCASREGNPDLYILQELDTASNIGDPVKRIERLKIFIKNHADHPVRVMAYKRIMETMAVDQNDPEAARKYFETTLSSENDPAIRGEICFRRFAYLWDISRDEAVSFADSLAAGPESDYKLFLYLAYYLMEEKGREDTAEKVFAKLTSIDAPSFKMMHAKYIYAEFLSDHGRRDEAADLLSEAGDYPLAGEMLGPYYWEKGEREKAIDWYTTYAACVPGAREHVKLDSLYAVAYPGADDLDAKILEKRVFDEGDIPDMDFSDLEGKTFRLSSYRGKVLLIASWSPT